jgi:hypothetical protein
MLRLLAPRIIASSGRRYRQLALDEGTFEGSFETLRGALRAGARLTRTETLHALEGAGISTKGQRGYHILRRAGLEGLICFGPALDGEETFVLLDEWAPDDEEKLEREESLAKLARCYFRSHGPATLRDFAWWSGLMVSDARAGLELAVSEMQLETIDGRTYWAASKEPTRKDRSPTIYLLPGYDEYYLGYQDRGAVLDIQYDKSLVSSNGVFRPMIVLEGQVVGIWRWRFQKGAVIITPSPFEPLSEVENRSLRAAAEQYGSFLGRAAALGSE